MKSLVIDNFFKNPNDVRNFGLTLNYRSRNPDEYFEGLRSDHLHTIDRNFCNNVCSKIILEYFGNGNYNYEASVFFHQTSTSDKFDSQWLTDKVHTDPVIVTGIMFLTPDAPINCGTQTYQKVNGEYIPDVVMGNKFNRLIAYNGDVPHSAMDFFGDGVNSRLVMLFFLEKITKENGTTPVGVIEPLVYEGLS